nr:unnamed protein product [Callosobruchus chinensis]
MSYKDLWHKKWGPPFFTETMSRNRFTEIMKYLRFDIQSTRIQRKKTDRFCLASEIWNKFIDNCIACYTPGESLTVDEQLYPCQSRCPFIQYMPSKPDKYGIKYWLLCDAQTRYILSGIPYLGKDETQEQGVSLGTHVVLQLARPFLDKGRNITCDNFFTSLELAEKLKQRKTSLVGTLRRNKVEVPQPVQSGDDAYYSTFLYKHNETLLTAYQSKRKKNVLILSSLHTTGCKVEQETEKKKPETVEYYNKNKGGVDVVDKMTRQYNVRAGYDQCTYYI